METNSSQRSILIVDDEADIREILQFNLQNEGYHIDTANSAEQALSMLSAVHDLLILDVMMEGMSGLQLANHLRERGDSRPIVFLTAKSSENDLLTGFSTGADDYISKPFSIKEVIARVKSILKRTENRGDQRLTKIVVGGMCIDLNRKTTEIDGEYIDLTKTEFSILLLLVQSQKRVLTRSEILDRVWSDESIVMERTVDVHIARLRRKIGAYGALITNRIGYGYTFDSSTLEI